MTWTTICIPVPKDATTIDGSRRICFTVPVLIPVHLDPRPPFVTHPAINQEYARHLQVLATIDQIAEELPGELSHDIQHSVAAHLQSLGRKLGVGIELSRHTSNG
jgi:hypothetical protein